jgi:hypothetical protein
MDMFYVYLLTLSVAVISFGFGFWFGYGEGRIVGVMIGKYQAGKATAPPQS